MTIATLETVQRLIDQLTPVEQVRLLEYLTPRIVRAVTTHQPAMKTHDTPISEAWQRFFQIGDALAVSDQSDRPTLTQTVQRMRR
jgi:hypothetical protein